MKKEAKNEIQGSGLPALQELLIKEREQLRAFRFQASQGKTKDVKAGYRTRKTIARILTRMNQLRAKA